MIGRPIGRVYMSSQPSEKEARRKAQAERALAEAEERRAKAPARILPEEHGGPTGPEPTRFGDWEKKGIVSDF
jgi:hypothetical protein